MCFIDGWKKSDLNSVPSEPIWGCTMISLTSLKGFLSVHATKKWSRRKPSRKILAIWMCEVWQTISLSLLFERLVKYVPQWWMKKVWPEFFPFRTHLRVQHDISHTFQRFSIRSFNKKMKMQETFKKKSGYMNVRSVTNDFLIITLLKTR